MPVYNPPIVLENQGSVQGTINILNTGQNINASATAAIGLIDLSTLGSAGTITLGDGYITFDGYGRETSWKTPTSLGGVTSIATASPITGGTITTSGTIGITQSGASSDGYLSQTDWNTFNSKLSSAVTSITASSPLTGGTITSTGSIGIPKADATHDGYLSQQDWTTFNNKQPAGSYALQSTTISTTSPLTGGGDLSTNRTLSIPAATGSVNGYLTSTDWTTFNNKGSGSVTSITASSPLTGGTITASGTIAIPKSDATHDGYLYQGDWTTFNNKIGGSGTNNQMAYFNASGTITSSSNFTVSGTKLTVSGHIGVDGYTIDISAGATTNQVLQYNGTSFVAATISSGGITGTFSNNQVIYGNSANTTVQGSSNLTFDGTTLTLGSTGYVKTTATSNLPPSGQWIAVSGGVGFQNSYTDQAGGAYYNCAYMKDACGFVHLRGLAGGGTAGATIFTLPVGYRPSATVICTCTVDDVATGQIRVDTSGHVFANNAQGSPAGHTDAKLDPTSFYAEG